MAKYNVYHMVFPMITPENKSMKPLTYKPATTKRGEEKIRAQFTKKLAKRIRGVRKQKKMTQEELAFEAGLNSAYLGHLERGVYSPTLFVVWKIAKALKIELEELLKDF